MPRPFSMSPFALFAFILTLFSLGSAERMIKSNSLNACQANSNFTASLFNVVFTPANRSVNVDVVGVSSISGNIIAELELIAYGYTALRQKVDPCKLNLNGLCPMSTGQINLQTNFQDIGADTINKVPGIAYTVPDLDGIVRVYINSTETGKRVACVEAELSNGKTVNHKAVGWFTAVIAGLGLIASAITSGMGHSNTAAHIAANALSLFGYYQAQIMIGMTSVNLPPIVQAWTQNFAWTMGIMKVGFMQKAFTWYQRATGGTPTALLYSLSTVSVEVQKRSVDVVHHLFLRAYDDMVRRSNVDNNINEVQKTVVVRGIERVSFKANIESTNLFMTGLAFFIIFVILVALCVAAFKGICEASVKAGWMNSDKFQDFRNGWIVVLKGIMFRIVRFVLAQARPIIADLFQTLIGFPQICVLCLWELTQRDSAAEVVLALFFFFGLSATLGWASWKVISQAKRSVSMHKNPAYILYSDPVSLNKWGFLYVQFRATAYYFIVPVLAYTLVKAIFIAFAQSNGTAQAIGLLLIETGVLIGISILRPWMDKKTNTFNISIGAINFLNAVFLLVFTEVFNQPGIVTGVMGVVFFGLNAVFAFVLLILVLVSSIYAIFSKNPDTRYQPMRDDRGSFIKSQTQLNQELDALGATARGDTEYKGRNLDDDTSSFSSASLARQNGAAGGTHLAPGSSRGVPHGEPPHSPVDPSVPLFPSDSGPRSGPPSYSGLTEGRSNTLNSSVSGFRQQNNSSPWQRGAGYDH
ncbi:MAG: hypothetical protein M1833_005154 [Piccolia ochrophora]|nr:MAG: hypothetical protein M1833_005154 [Piccolia ochrophora]